MRSIAVIGVSSFGYYLCKYLSEAGVQVMAIDINERKVNLLKNVVRKAIVADARDKETLNQLELKDFDAVVLTVGDKIDTSILITLYLRELEVKEIIAKAVTEEHAKILNMIGATSIVFPERDMAQRIAYTLRRSNLIDYFPMGDDYSVIEIAPPDDWIGKTLAELNVRVRYNVQIIMIKELVPENTILIPSGAHVVKESDVLVIIGKDEDLNRIEKL